MAELTEEILKQLESILAELKESLQEVGEEVKAEAAKPGADMKVFFDSVRNSLFGGHLTADQVAGMEAKIVAFTQARWPLSWAAYALATSYHETAQRMMPVREGLDVSDRWRQKNLRYYPWYGRGDVQLTWEYNYKKADDKLGLGGRLVEDLDLALDPSISAKIMVQGMEEGWFTKRKLGDFLKENEETLANFRRARTIINGVDKALKIAKEAVLFQTALKEAKYGNTNNR